MQQKYLKSDRVNKPWRKSKILLFLFVSTLSHVYSETILIYWDESLKRKISKKILLVLIIVINSLVDPLTGRLLTRSGNFDLAPHALQTENIDGIK